STPICRLIRTTHSRKRSRLGAEWIPRENLQYPSWIDRNPGFRPSLGHSRMTISREFLAVFHPAQARRTDQSWILIADQRITTTAGKLAPLGRVPVGRPTRSKAIACPAGYGLKQAK